MQKPEVGMLYPAFNDRSTDLHAALWYAKNEESRHDELAAALLGMDLPMPRTAEQDVFREVIEVSLGKDCSFENVKNISEAVNRILEEGKDEPEPVLLGQHEIRQILYDSGADEEALGRFDKAYGEIAGEDSAPLLAESVAAPKKLFPDPGHRQRDGERHPDPQQKRGEMTAAELQARLRKRAASDSDSKRRQR